MTALLLLYLCTDATRTDCQALPAQIWQGPDAYEQCIAAIPSLRDALTVQNHQRHQFVCEIQADAEQDANYQPQPTLTYQSFRM
ncbi:hypothetical protein [Pseudomonas agarici]|uniref:hypothetical protein n=1 Tax=Pseudomonas agarici TaxID=46677 RepID=UPI0015A442CA|nr:hypothetical protein [Pseudomonas agarici]NWB91634.1 hypothetical protein [Pseudomonas agarici]